MGDKIRAEMYLELERVVKELKELKYQLEKAGSFIGTLSISIQVGNLDNALSTLERPEAEDFLNPETLGKLLRTILDFQAGKSDLEKKLSIKISIE